MALGKGYGAKGKTNSKSKLPSKKTGSSKTAKMGKRK